MVLILALGLTHYFNKPSQVLLLLQVNDKSHKIFIVVPC